MFQTVIVCTGVAFIAGMWNFAMTMVCYEGFLILTRLDESETKRKK